MPHTLSEDPRIALIAIDWGTTAVRAYGVDASGEVLAVRNAPLGIQSVDDGRFGAALDALLGDWSDVSAPRLACGMIGSRQGWVEAPYAECPVDLRGLAETLVRTPGGELAIVPGARCLDASGVPDVMRGEETQLAGARFPEDRPAFAVLPGTHSKWAWVERGRLVDFATFMTGELYAILLAHSILGRMADRSGSDGGSTGGAFARGVDRGLAGGGLSHLVFGTRTLALAGELEPREVGDWLSGVLIGDEIAAAQGWVRDRGGAGAPLQVIGGEAIAKRYLAALARAGIAAERGPADAAAHGLFRIAQRANLVA